MLGTFGRIPVQAARCLALCSAYAYRHLDVIADVPLQLRLFDALVVPVLLFGVEV